MGEFYGVDDLEDAALLTAEQRANYSDRLGFVLPLAPGEVVAHVHDDKRVHLDLQLA